MNKPFVFGGLLVSVVLLCWVADVSGSPGRGRSGGKGGSGWFGNNGRSNKGYDRNKYKGYGNAGYGSGGYGAKKKSKYSTLKKAAVIGAAAYGGYQLGKLTSNFGRWGWGGQHGYGFNEWNRWREIDGFLCRENSDCNWIDPQLYCQDYELDFQPSALWFGGDVARIVGECACPRGQVWDDREMRCETSFFSGVNLVWVILVPLVMLCCFCGIAFFILRRVCGAFL